jgi:hypothetical protein
METTAKDLMIYVEKARLLEKRINQTLTFNQLREVAQECAKSYHVLTAQLMAKGITDRTELAELSQKFSKIENEALMKFYGRDCAGPTRAIL